MRFHEEDFIFHSRIYEIKCPLTNYNFIDTDIKSSVYYYNAKVIVGGDIKFGDDLVNVILSPCKEDYSLTYENYIEEATTFIKNGVIPMLFLPSMLNRVTDEDIKWYLEPIPKFNHIETFREVKLEWNKKKLEYENPQWIETNIKI